MRPPGGADRRWWAAVAVAALLCGGAAWSYARAAGEATRAYAESRDTALAAGREHVARLSSLDGRRAEEGLRTWLEVSAGELREELERTKPPADVSARATVTDAALTALDDRAGTARLIATVRVEITAAARTAGPPATDRKRLEADLVRTGDGWKVTALTALPATGT
ncbi:hypothetical protein [Streptomyces sp. NRRL S-118]|uniref:hypothetical protein n=1 Tax=Streptomyces sp. NRRL S-118 TaxID=1463881 RepID=UPI0004CB11C3|nr:hypothetical protein [Streptomyces sp. NRRL S-118]